MNPKELEAFAAPLFRPLVEEIHRCWQRIGEIRDEEAAARLRIEELERKWWPCPKCNDGSEYLMERTCYCSVCGYSWDPT